MASKILLALLGLLLLATSVQADPALIWSGTATITNNFGMPVTAMNFSGANFSVAAFGNGFPTGGVPCNPCAGGNVITLSAYSGFWAYSDVGGTMTINGVQYTFLNQAIPPASLPNVVGSGSMSFAASSVMVPISNDPTVTLTAPFSVTVGNLSGTAFNGRVGLDFSGSIWYCVVSLKQSR